MRLDEDEKEKISFFQSVKKVIAVGIILTVVPTIVNAMWIYQYGEISIANNIFIPETLQVFGDHLIAAIGWFFGIVVFAYLGIRGISYSSKKTAI